MIVVSDTTPVIGLTVIGHFDLLPKLFGQIVIPFVLMAYLVERG